MISQTTTNTRLDKATMKPFIMEDITTYNTIDMISSHHKASVHHSNNRSKIVLVSSSEDMYNSGNNTCGQYIIRSRGQTQICTRHSPKHTFSARRLTRIVVWRLQRTCVTQKPHKFGDTTTNYNLQSFLKGKLTLFYVTKSENI